MSVCLPKSPVTIAPEGYAGLRGAQSDSYFMVLQKNLCTHFGSGRSPRQWYKAVMQVFAVRYPAGVGWVNFHIPRSIPITRDPSIGVFKIIVGLSAAKRKRSGAISACNQTIILEISLARVLLYGAYTDSCEEPNFEIIDPFREYAAVNAYYGLALSPDGKSFMTGYMDKFQLWDINTGESLFELPYDGFVTSIVSSKDGAKVLASSHYSDSRFVHLLMGYRARVNSRSCSNRATPGSSRASCMDCRVS